MLVKDKQQLLTLLRDLKNVWVTGTSGSGKSTIGNTARKAGIKTYDLDTHGQHAKFASGSDYWIADAIQAWGHDLVVGTCDNDTVILDKLKFRHVILPTLEYDIYVKVMEAKGIDQARRHGQKDAFANDFYQKSKLSKSQFERNYKDTEAYFRALSVYYKFTLHLWTLKTIEDVPLEPWNRSGL